MKYVKTFETHSEYESYIEDISINFLPNVSYCKNTNDVHYNPYDYSDYSKAYLTFEALESGEICFNIWKSMGTDTITSISYSTDDGETWTTTQNVNNKSENLQISVNVEEGDKVLWKGIATQTGYFDEDWGAAIGSFFSSDCRFNAYGNIMSLLYEDDFADKIILNNEFIFYSLFYDYDGGDECLIVSAENLILPATTLTEDCYYGMFYHCTALTTAPELPATTLANSCYSNMFYGCTSLTTAPALPATTLANYCYDGMFSGCTALTTAPELPATTLAQGCYNYMFGGCTALTTAPVLPATTLALAYGCYSFMFQDCTSLTTAPELPATTLANNCYDSMFSGCTALTTAPELPATTLASNCYSGMFYSCTSLVTAPELPATTLATGCYARMFYNCSQLNYIKAMFTTTPSTTYTQNWVSGVAASGTFVKNSAANWSVTGTSGVPSGWTVQTASE